MKRQIIFLSLGLSLWCGTVAISSPEPTWSFYFPTDKTVSAHVMKIGASEELQHIVEKYQSAINKNEEWFNDYIKQIPKGQPVPYSKKFGISEADYKKMESGTDKKLFPAEKLELHFKKIDAQHIKLTTTPDSHLNNIVIANDEIVTPLGKLTSKSIINNSKTQSITGPWNGLQWKLLEYDAKAMQGKKASEIKGKELIFAVGILKNSGQHIIYYNAKDIDRPAGRDLQFNYIVTY